MTFGELEIISSVYLFVNQLSCVADETEMHNYSDISFVYLSLCWMLKFSITE